MTEGADGAGSMSGHITPGGAADEGAGISVGVLIATRNRAALLERALGSVDAACAAVAAPVQVVVVDNGSTDRTAELLADWAAARPHGVRLSVSEPGKARALNVGLGALSSALVVFTDDDVEVRGDWLWQVVDFFARHPHYAAATGRVRLPPTVTAAELLERVAHFGTLPLFDLGDEVRDTHHLYGCNMAVRRPVLERIGPFDERLGPGASGLHEDGELGQRILRAGLRIGYMPETVVYHVVEPDRLTDAYFREHHRRDARSRFVMQGQPRRLASLGRLLGAAAVFALWTAAGNRRRQTRARSRLISHAEMVRLCWRR